MRVVDKNQNRKSIFILALVCAFLQLAIAPQITIAKGHPNFAIIFALSVALLAGGIPAVWAGFGAGLFFDLSATHPVGIMAAILTMTAYLVGATSRDRLSGLPLSLWGFVLAVISAISFIYTIALLITGTAGSPLEALFASMVPMIVLTFIFSIPILWVVSRIATSSAPLSLGARTSLKNAEHRNARR